MVIFIKTRLFVVTLFLLVLISIAGVNAADVNDSDDLVTFGENVEVIDSDSSFEGIEVSDGDSSIDEDINAALTSENEGSDNSIDEVLSQSNEDENNEVVLSEPNGLVGDFTELELLINNSNGEIFLEKDYIYNNVTDAHLMENGVTVGKTNLIIDGQGHIIDGQGLSSLMHMQLPGGNLTLKNVRLVNGFSNPSLHDFAHWGPLAFVASTPHIINCTFYNNTGPSGAMYILLDGIIENCTFINNTGTEFSGALMGMYSYQLYLINNKFIGNHGPTGGALRFNLFGAVLYNTFEDNTADLGGAIFLDFEGYINTSAFIHNKAEYGGAIYTNKTANIENSYFYFNYAVDNTNNIWAKNGFEGTNNTPNNLTSRDFKMLQEDIDNCEGNVFTLTDDYFCTDDEKYEFRDGVRIRKDNFVIDGQGHVISGGYRAGIFDVLGDNVTFKNINFIGGHHDGSNGGAIYFHGPGAVNNCTFLENWASNGGAIYFHGPGAVHNCTFLENWAFDGGAVYFSESGRVTNSIFVNNSVDIYGGAVYFNDTGYVNSCTFVENTANKTGSLGGAIYSYGLCEIRESDFTLNKGPFGGAVFLSSGGTVVGGTFLFNQATYDGGAIVSLADLYIRSTNFPINIGRGAYYNIRLYNNAVLTVEDTTPRCPMPRSFSTLDNKIRDSGSYLIITEDYMYYPEYDHKDGIRITKDNLVIDGDGYVLFGGNQIRLFTIEGENVTLKNFIFMNFTADGTNGNSIIEFLKSGTIENCTFIDNSATESIVSFVDGEIRNSNFINNTVLNLGTINLMAGTVDNCVFSENVGVTGGAIYMGGYGVLRNSTFYGNNATNAGAVYIKDNAFITNCSFVQNHADNIGGVLYSENMVTIEASNFMLNEAGYSAGVGYVFREGFVTDSNFIMNKGLQFYGALNFARGTVINSNFTSNQGGRGAAAHFSNNGFVINSTFNLNENLDDIGGALFFQTLGTLKDSTFNLNIGKYGGAVGIGTYGQITNCTFNMNEALIGAAVCAYNENVDIINSTFNNNTGENNVIFFNETGTLSDCIFNINQAKNGDLIFADSDLKIINSSFNGNQATNGSLIYMSKGGDIRDSDFYYNYADLDAGSILYINSTGAVKDTTFTNDIGRAIVLIKGNGDIDNCNFNNTISNFGAVCIESTGVVNNSKFNNNSGIANTSGICINSGNVENSEFTNNSGNYSSSIYSIGDLTVDNCNFTGNLGNQSGAVHMNNGLVKNSYFFNNSAAANGSAIYMNNAVVNNCTFDSNLAGENGGAIFSMGTSEVNNSIFDSNLAAQDGGAIYSNIALVDGSKFVNHIAGQNGGAIYANNASLEDNYFHNNTAVYDGGAVYIKETGMVKNTEFDANIAAAELKSHGGALYINNGLVDNCTFVNSIVATVGGAIYAVDAIVNNSFFDNNSAHMPLSAKGGAIDFKKNGTVENSIFKNNHVDYMGGAVCFEGQGNIKNCSFDNNKMVYSDDMDYYIGYGGAVAALSSPFSVVGSNFTNNIGGTGGAIFMSGGEVFNCYFLNNSAKYNDGGAISSIRKTDIDGCAFINNSALRDGGAVDLSIFNSTVQNSFFIGNSALNEGGALSTDKDALVKNSIFYANNASAGGAISAKGILDLQYSAFEDNTADDGTNNVKLIGDDARLIPEHVTPEDLGPVRVLNSASNSPYIIVASDNAYVINYGGKYSLMVKDKFNVLAVGGTVDFILDGVNIGSAITDENGMATFTITPAMLKAAKAGTKNLVIKFTDANGVSASKTVNITINKEKSSIAAKAKSYVINYGGKYSITLKDSKGKAIANKKVTFYLKGKKIGTAKTNSKGVATIKLTAKILKTAKAGKRNLAIKFAEDSYYSAASKTVKITIKKEKVKLTAKNKSFKRLLKTKKYAVVLKNSKGKAVKKLNLILKVKGKTYKAKTNAKGKAIFNIKKLYKKGTFKASITFKGNAYYAKAVKKVSIKMK